METPALAAQWEQPGAVPPWSTGGGASTGEPVEGFQDWGDVIIFVHPHQDPGSAVLDVLQSLNALARDPDECIAVVQPGGDKGVDGLL